MKIQSMKAIIEGLREQADMRAMENDEGGFLRDAADMLEREVNEDEPFTLGSVGQYGKRAVMQGYRRICTIEMPSDFNGKLTIEERRAARDKSATMVVAALNKQVRGVKWEQGEDKR